MGVRHYKDCRRAYLDMDGVLIDYEAKANDLGLPVKTLKTVPGIYETMDPMPGAKHAVGQLLHAGIDVWALTKPPKENPSAASDKLRSIWRHFPEIGEQVIITPDKGCVGTARDFLVDDHPEWANAHNFPGTVLTFKGDWDEIVKAILNTAQSA